MKLCIRLKIILTPFSGQDLFPGKILTQDFFWDFDLNLLNGVLFSKLLVQAKNNVRIIRLIQRSVFKLCKTIVNRKFH